MKVQKPIPAKQYGAEPHPDLIRFIPVGVQTVLDVGCGCGTLARFVKTLGIVADGITLSDAEASVAKSCCRRVFVHNLETGLPPSLPNGYDCAICSHVLEHICYPSALLSDLRTKIRSGGYLLVAIPNMLYIRERLKLLAGVLEYRETGLMDYTHIRWYTLKSARRLLRDAGFIIEKASVTASVPMGPLRKFVPLSVSTQMERLAGRLFPGLFGWQMIFLYRNP